MHKRQNPTVWLLQFAQKWLPRENEKKGDCLTKNSVKSRQKQRKNGKNYRFGEFLVRTDPGANGFRAEIVVLRPEGVVTYVEREETAIE